MSEPSQLGNPENKRKGPPSATKERLPPLVAVAAAIAHKQMNNDSSEPFSTDRGPEPSASEQLPLREGTIEMLDMTADDHVTNEDDQSSPYEFAGYPSHLAPARCEEEARPRTPSTTATESASPNEASGASRANTGFEDIDMMPSSPTVQQSIPERSEDGVSPLERTRTLTGRQSAHVTSPLNGQPIVAATDTTSAQASYDQTNDPPTTHGDTANKFQLNDIRTGVPDLLEALDRIERLPPPLKSFILARYDMDTIGHLTLAEVPRIARSLHRSAARQEEEVQEDALRQQRSPARPLAIS